MSREEFVVTADHIKLLKAAVVRWDDSEFGAPAIDSKRPYGNSSVLLDIAEILGDEVNYEGDLEDAQYNRYTKTHYETATALQIFLNVGRMVPGRYVRDGWKDWQMVVGYESNR